MVDIAAVAVDHKLTNKNERAPPCWSAWDGMWTPSPPARWGSLVFITDFPALLLFSSSTASSKRSVGTPYRPWLSNYFVGQTPWSSTLGWPVPFELDRWRGCLQRRAIDAKRPLQLPLRPVPGDTKKPGDQSIGMIARRLHQTLPESQVTSSCIKLYRLNHPCRRSLHWASPWLRWSDLGPEQFQIVKNTLKMDWFPY